MVAQDTPFIYHPRSRAAPSSSGWYMNGISWATIVYLLHIHILQAVPLIFELVIVQLYIESMGKRLKYAANHEKLLY